MTQASTLDYFARRNIQRPGVFEVLEDSCLEYVNLTVGIETFGFNPAALYLTDNEIVKTYRHFLVKNKLNGGGAEFTLSARSGDIDIKT